jgi:hypothetical protein
MKTTHETRPTHAGTATDRTNPSAPGNLATTRPSMTWMVDLSGLVSLLRGGVTL